MKIEFSKEDLPKIKRWLWVVPAFVSLSGFKYVWDNACPDAKLAIAGIGSLILMVVAASVYVETNK